MRIGKHEINPPAKWSRVSVTWEDIAHESEAQVSETYMAEYEPAIRETAGWFLGYVNGRVFVTLSKDAPLEGDTTDCQAIDIIPEGAIIDFEVLVPAKPKRTRKKAAR